MKSNKGFTLIELLAVIVILAIVALVATPVILNIINSSTNKAKDSSARLVIKSVELAYTTYLSTSHGNVSAGTPPTTQQLIDEFNGMMDSGTNWSGTTITSGNVTCTQGNGTASGTIKVSCTLSDTTTINTKDLAVSSS